MGLKVAGELVGKCKSSGGSAVSNTASIVDTGLSLVGLVATEAPTLNDVYGAAVDYGFKLYTQGQESQTALESIYVPAHLNENATNLTAKT